MKGNTCFFTGHRRIPQKELPELKQRLEMEIKFLIENALVRNFGTGGALGFDTLAAEAVLAIRQTEPKIKLILVLPHHAQAQHWKREDRERYQNILALADKIVYTSQFYYTGCYHKRNRHLVENSAYCICYVRKDFGGAWFTREYAKEKNVFINEL